MSEHLIACVLGGSAPGAKTELHDVAFAVGSSLESVHQQLLDAWFGSPRGLHVDAWTCLDTVAGYRIQLAREPASNGLHLYFINIGGYQRGQFGEQHAWGFFGARNKAEAKALAKQGLLLGHEHTHKDDLYDIDDCLRVDDIDGWHVHLREDANATAASVSNGYFPLPAATIESWLGNKTR
ncbi:MAG: DUF1543 domain-containing protein [Xanthomonadales bacterium]|nr:DUF1543 domain-containing protein [Xanthomonadales bacterium]